jgi:hypothetical protein
VISWHDFIDFGKNNRLEISVVQIITKNGWLKLNGYTPKLVSSPKKFPFGYRWYIANTLG